MALTKHQKLARGIKSLLDALDIHYEKTAATLNVLQLHFYETHLIVGRPLMSERALAALMYTHRCGLKYFASNEELRTAAQLSPLIGCVITPRLYLRSRTLIRPRDLPKNAKWFIPWGVKWVLPSESLLKLEEAKLEALLYCASTEEMSDWIKWFEREDISNTLTNQIFAIGEYSEKMARLAKEKEIYEKNLNESAFPHFETIVSSYCTKNVCPKISKTLLNNDFTPKKQSSIAESYEILISSLKKRKRRYFEDFQQLWKERLIELMFQNLEWTKEQIEAALTEFSPKKHASIKKVSDPRWQSGLVIDRKTYASFIKYFTDRFLQNPSRHQIDGEIVLLLWIMIYLGRKSHIICPITQLLKLTTAHIEDRTILLEGEGIELSLGLTELIKDFIGTPPKERPQKLFPHLTIDKLEDHFRRASAVILPPGSQPALPQAFLIFPHTHEHLRMRTQLRLSQLQNPPSIYPSAITSEKIKQQLLEKMKKTS
jgi:hypothetical protein